MAEEETKTTKTARKAPATRKAPSGKMFIAQESGVCEVDGQELTFIKGRTRVREGHALLAAVPDGYFLEVEDVPDFETRS